MDSNKPKNTREHIIMELKRAGSLNTKELAALLGITATAVRQVLTALQADGYVAARAERQPQGRPSHLYTLTQRGHELFPDAYDTLAVELLETLRDMGGDDLVRDIMTKQLKKKEERYRALIERNRPLFDKLAQLSALRDDDGYMSEVVSSGGTEGVALREYNCPILRVAKEHPEVCAHELALMERILGTTLERTHHILAGEHFCCFRVETGEQTIAIEVLPAKKV